MNYLPLIFLIILSILMIFKPNILWKIEHIFTVKGGKPTDTYINYMRLGGTIFLVSSVVIIIYLIVQAIKL